jgi:hypothetical protein
MGTSIIAGVVTLGDDARTPVRRSVITLTAADGLQTFAAISGDDGRFIIEHVRAGRYILEAAKPAHPTLAYGARRPGARGTLLVVAEAERVDDLILSLPRGGVLAGTLTFSSGQPAGSVQVTAVPSSLAGIWGASGVGTRTFRTDDLGEFRIFGLSPGSYFVAALPTFGRDDIERMPDDAISSVLGRLRQPGSPVGLRVVSPSMVTYAPTYLPGTASVGDATPVTVGAGQVRENLSFAIVPYLAATVRGRIVGINGAPIRDAVLSLEAVGPAFPTAGSAAARVLHPDSNGAFQIAAVAPGLYRVRARAGGVKLDANGGLASMRSDAQTQYAVTEFSVAGENIDGIVLSLQEGSTFSGTLTGDGLTAAPAWMGASVVVESITLRQPSVLAGGLTVGVPRREASADDEGRFSVNGLEPSEYQIRVTLPPALVSRGWHVESIRKAGSDLRDAPLTFGQGSLEGVEIRVTTTVTELSGRLVNASGTPAGDYFVVAFPADRTLWHSASPRVRMLRPAVDGTFSTQDLPPGTYRLAVLTDVEEYEPRQREFLNSIYDGAVEISIARGRVTRQELRVGRLAK